jgi:hypothetical protein
MFSLQPPRHISTLPIVLQKSKVAGSRIFRKNEPAPCDSSYPQSAVDAHVLKNAHLDPSGHHVGRAQMILGLLYKIKKNAHTPFSI